MKSWSVLKKCEFTPESGNVDTLNIVSPAAIAKLAIDSTSLECLVINREIFIPV